MADTPRYRQSDPDPEQETDALPAGESKPGMPRWVKVSLIIAAVLILVAFVLVRMGGHQGGPGPGGHGLGGSAGLATVVEGAVRPA